VVVDTYSHVRPEHLPDAVARALMLSPQVLILDEPAAGPSAGTGAERS
jgi:ABC-type arginine transport system ATPase subunit